MQPISDAIFENLQQIEIIFSPTGESFKKDTKHTDDSKEITIKEFVESYFPKTYTVKKCPIYSQETISNEIDCVLLAPNHPPIVTPKREIIIAEGVHAAIEVKPDIATLTEKAKRKSRISCPIRNCCYDIEKYDYCIECEKYPCNKINKKLLKVHPGNPKYKYRHETPSVFTNLKDMDIDDFISSQQKRWSCPACGEVVHFYYYICSKCGKEVKV